MKFSWTVNLHDNEGDCYLKGIFLFLGEDDRTAIRFNSIVELRDFLKSITTALPEIQEAIDREP